MTDLEQAICNFRTAAARYDKPERYYRGDHDLAFATEKFENAFGSLFHEFALNLCPSICDAIRDKLKVTGFSVQSAGLTFREQLTANHQPPKDLENPIHPVSDHPPRLGVSAVHFADPPTANGQPPIDLHAFIDAIWSDNRMDLAAEEIHLEALKLGDSYAIVWPDEEGRVTIYPQRAAFCTVRYDDERPGRMLWAAKYWRLFDDGRIRLNLFYPDRIEKYISIQKCELSIPDAKDFVRVSEEIGRGASLPYVSSSPGLPFSPSAVPNPYGVIPVFHFANTSEIGTFGKSELSQAIPIQNGLNKAVLDMLVAMEFSAFRQRWVSGIEIEYDESGNPIPPFKCGMDRVWMTSNTDTTFGDFNTTDLDQFLKVKDSFRIDMAGVTGTPLHYFLQNERGFASAEALARAEARFLAKVRDRQRCFGQTWSDLMSFAVQLAGTDNGTRLLPQWLDPAPIAERELLENLVLKKKLGITTEQALIEAGYGRNEVTEMLSSAPPASVGGDLSEPPA